MKEHSEIRHGSNKCEKCEYSALDKEVMKEHVANHTGSILFICGVCEFEATRGVFHGQYGWLINFLSREKSYFR